MNKTIIININGIVFHIEEDAYEVLKNYMTDVKRHFMNSADSLEITTDIENRIAEMFNEILAKENKQVVVEQDVKSVIEQMGTVEDFENAENDAQASFNAYNFDSSTRRLFRDPEDRLVSGVCAGVANYFDIQPVWIRLAFALSFFFFGSGLILYIILWIVIPKAVTRADRMAMKGEKLNLQGFKKNFEEELSSVKTHLSNFQHEARPFAYKVRDFAGDFLHLLGDFFGGAGKVLVKLVGIFILLLCFGLGIALVVAFVGAVIIGNDPVGIFPFSVIQNHFATKIYVSAFIVALIPLLAIILLTIRVVFNAQAMGKTTGYVMLIIWICAISSLTFYGVKVANDFRVSAKFTQSTVLKATANNTYHLKLNDVKYFTHEDSVRLDIKNHFGGMIVINDDDDDNNGPNSVRINVERGDVPQPVLVQTYLARGANYDDALINARNTKYIYTQQDSILKFDYRLQRLPGEQWHGEALDITLKLPLNAKLVVDDNMGRIMDVNVYDCKNDNKQPNATSATFIMTTNGLQCKVDTLVADTTKRSLTDTNKTVKP